MAQIFNNENHSNDPFTNDNRVKSILNLEKNINNITNPFGNNLLNNTTNINNDNSMPINSNINSNFKNNNNGNQIKEQKHNEYDEMLEFIKGASKIGYADNQQNSNVQNFDHLNKDLDTIIAAKDLKLKECKKKLEDNKFDFQSKAFNYKKLSGTKINIESTVQSLMKFYSAKSDVLYSDKIDNAEEELKNIIKDLKPSKFKSITESLFDTIKNENILSKQSGLSKETSNILSQIEKTVDHGKKKLENLFPDNPVKAFFVNLWMFVLHYVIGVVTYNDLLKSFSENIDHIKEKINLIIQKPELFHQLKKEVDEMLLAIKDTAKFAVPTGGPINLKELKVIETELENLRNDLGKIELTKEGQLKTSYDEIKDTNKAYLCGAKFIFGDSDKIFVTKYYSPNGTSELKERIELRQPYINNVLCNMFQMCNIKEPTPEQLANAVCSEVGDLLNSGGINNENATIANVLANIQIINENGTINLKGTDAIVYKVNEVISRELGEKIIDKKESQRLIELINNGLFSQSLSNLQGAIKDEMIEDTFKKHEEDVKKIKTYMDTVGDIVDEHQGCIGKLFELLDKTIHKETSYINEYIKAIGSIGNANSELLANKILYSKIQNTKEIIKNKIQDEIEALKGIGNKYNISQEEINFIVKENKELLSYYEKEVNRNIEKGEAIDQKNNERFQSLKALEKLGENLNKFNTKNEKLKNQDNELNKRLSDREKGVANILNDFNLSEEVIAKYLEDSAKDKKANRQEHDSIIKSMFDVVKTKMQSDPHDKNLQRVYGILEKLATGRSTGYNCDHHSEHNHHDHNHHCHNANMNNNVYNNTNANRGEIGYNKFNNTGINNSTENNLNNQYPPNYNKNNNDIDNNKNLFTKNQNPTVKKY
jgi:hypothetical protein